MATSNNPLTRNVPATQAIIKNGKLVPAMPVLKRPNAVVFGGKLVNVADIKEPKYNFTEAMRLSEYGYTGLFGRSKTKQTLGLLGENWQQQYALSKIRNNQNVTAFSIMDNTSPGVLKDLAAATPLAPGSAKYNSLLGLNTYFTTKYGADGEKYKNRWGTPKLGSKYGILFNTNNKDVRRDDVNVTYQNNLVKASVAASKDMLKYGNETNNEALKALALQYAGYGEYRVKSSRGDYNKDRVKEMESALNQIQNIHGEVAKALGGEAQSSYSRVATGVIGGLAGTLLLGPQGASMGAGFGMREEGAKKTTEALDYMNGLADSDVLKGRKTYWSGQDVPWSQKGLVGLTGNTLRGVARIGLGLPTGMVMVSDEAYLAGKETVKWAGSGGEYDWGNSVDFKLGDAVWADYAQRYYDPFATNAEGKGQSWWQGLDDKGNWDAAGERINSDPSALILDILDVAPIVGWGAKAGSLASTAARTGRVFGKVGLTAADRAALKSAKVSAASGAFAEYSVEAITNAQDLIKTIAEKPYLMDSLDQGVVEEAAKIASDTQAVQDLADIQAKFDAAPSARTFRRTMREAINGNSLSQAELSRWRAMGYEFNGADKSFSIRASALFEPRTKVLAKPDSVLEASDTAIVRLPASPIMRGMKEAYQWVGRGFDKAALAASEKSGYTGRVGTKFIDMPGLSYRYNYTKAIKHEAIYEYGDVTAEMDRAAKLLKIDNESDMRPSMARAVEAELMGGTGPSPLSHPAIQRQQVKDKIRGLSRSKTTGEVIDKVTLQNLESKLNELLDNEISDMQQAAESFDEMFNQDVTDLKRRLSDSTYKADDKQLDVAEALWRQMDKQDQAVRSRIVHDDTNPKSIAHLKLLYTEAMDGLRLSEISLFGKAGNKGRIGRFTNKVLRVNSNYLLTTLAKKGDREALINMAQKAEETGTVFDDIADPVVRKQREDQMVEAVDALSRRGMFVDGMGPYGTNGRPILVKSDLNVGSDFVAFHIPTLRHEVFNGRIKNGKIIDPEEVYVLPKVFFAAKNKGKGAVVIESPANGTKLLYEGSLNAMSNVYPEARFYSEKINDTGLRGVRENEQMIANTHSVAKSGMRQHALSRVIQSQVYYMRNRVERDLRGLAESMAVLVPAESLVGKSAKESGYQVLANVRPFDTAEAALDFARERGVGREAEQALAEYAEGTLTPINDSMDLTSGLGVRIKPNGEPEFLVRGGMHEWVNEALQEDLAKHSTMTSWIEREFSKPEDIPRDGLVLAVPNRAYKNLSQMSVESDNLSARILSAGAVKGWGNLMKWFVLNANPGFIANNVIGGMAMMLMYNPSVAPRLISSMVQKMARETIAKGLNNDAFTARLATFKNDSEAVARSLAYENNNNVYRQDSGIVGAVNEPDSITDFGGKKAAWAKKYVQNGGYTLVSTWEEMMRRNVAMEFLHNDAGFQSFMRGPEVKKYIDNNQDWHGNVRDADEPITPFEAATDLLLDRGSKYFNAELKHKMRYQTNTVSGNYHYFNPTEQLMRNVIMPFYAWQRHSATFSYRMLVDKPITTNVLYSLGEQGYQQNAEQGVEDWMMNTIPVPRMIKDMFDITDDDFRIDGNALSPFGTSGEMGMAAFSHLTGAKSNNNVFDFTNPYINQMIKDTLHVDPRTGNIDWKALQDQTADGKGVMSTFGTAIGGFYKATYPYKLNELRKYKEYEDDALSNRYASVDNAADILKNFDPNDPNATWHLKIPELRSIEAPDPTQRLFSALGIKTYHMDPTTLPMGARQDAVGAMVLKLVNDNAKKTAASRATSSATEWKRKYDYVMQVWLPVAEAQGMDSAQIQLVLSKIRDERPKTGIAKQLTSGYGG